MGSVCRTLAVTGDRAGLAIDAAAYAHRAIDQLPEHAEVDFGESLDVQAARAGLVRTECFEQRPIPFVKPTDEVEHLLSGNGGYELAQLLGVRPAAMNSSASSRECVRLEG